jgi:hypothetical protein
VSRPDPPLTSEDSEAQESQEGAQVHWAHLGQTLPSCSLHHLQEGSKKSPNKAMKFLGSKARDNITANALLGTGHSQGLASPPRSSLA